VSYLRPAPAPSSSEVWLVAVELNSTGAQAASRIILGMHFLSDVVAGSVLGAALGYGAFRLFA